MIAARQFEQLRRVVQAQHLRAGRRHARAEETVAAAEVEHPLASQAGGRAPRIEEGQLDVAVALAHNLVAIGRELLILPGAPGLAHTALDQEVLPNALMEAAHVFAVQQVGQRRQAVPRLLRRGD